VGRDPETIQRCTSVFDRFQRKRAESLRESGISTFVFEYDTGVFDFKPLRPWLAWRDEVNSDGG